VPAQGWSIRQRGAANIPFIHLCPFGDDEGEVRRRRPIEVDYSRYCARDVLPFSSIRDFTKRAPFSDEHGGPMPIARVRKPVSARVRAASYPAWPIVIEPGSGSLCASESIKLLLRAFRPSHNDEIAVPTEEFRRWAGASRSPFQTSSPAFMGGAYPSVRSRVRNLRKPSAAVRRDGRGGTANRRGELDPENETVGEGGALPLESADGAGAGHEADTQEAQRSVQGGFVGAALIKAFPCAKRKP
jgi:hypothetical protein